MGNKRKPRSPFSPFVNMAFLKERLEEADRIFDRGEKESAYNFLAGSLDAFMNFNKKILESELKK